MVVAGNEVVVVDVEVVVDVVVDPFTGPQNCTFEMSGRFLSFPTFGRPAFENVPEYCGGEYVVSTDAGPPFTITPDTASVELQCAPDAEALESVTTCSFPAGSSKE